MSLGMLNNLTKSLHAVQKLYRLESQGFQAKRGFVQSLRLF
jgi:hypothetical protein